MNIKNALRTFGIGLIGVSMMSCSHEDIATYTLTQKYIPVNSLLTYTTRSDVYSGGATVNISAPDLSGMAFYQWGASVSSSGSAFSFGNVRNAYTTLVMPSSDITITATYYKNQWNSAVPLTANFNPVSTIWGQTAIVMGGSQKYTTNQTYTSKNVAAFSIKGSASDYITTTATQGVTVTLPANALGEVWDIDAATPTVIADNISTKTTTITFTAQPNHRYGGFVWYNDNTQKDISISAN